VKRTRRLAITNCLLLGLGILAALFFAAYDLIALFQTGCVDIFNIGIFCGSDAIVPAIGQTALYGLTAASFAQLYFRKSKTEGSTNLE